MVTSSILSRLVEYWKTQEKNPTIEEVFTEWNDRRLERGQIKKATHTRNIEIFNQFYTDFKKRRISYVQDSDWEDFLCDAIVEYQLTAKAFSNLKGITKGFLKRAKKRNLLKMNVESFFQELDVSDHDFKRRVINDEDEELTSSPKHSPDTDLCLFPQTRNGLLKS